MFCYRCNGTLDLHRNICPTCGADVTMYKKIVYASNKHYNEALSRAKAHDLTGARNELYLSLHFNKKNVPARNLLGLVLYGMGESAEAVKEWVISANLMKNNNIANRYINHMKRSSHDLNSENHGIVKFNQALTYAKNGSMDMAVIQLKKVISVHPNMVKAYELLALLYIDDEKYDQARKVLKSCLEVDHGNVNALNYLHELDHIEAKTGSVSIGVAGEDDRETYIVPVRLRDYGTFLSNAIYVLTGVLVGVLIAYFVIVPGKVSTKLGDADATVKAYESRILELQDSLAVFEQESKEAKATETTEQPTEESTEDGSEVASEDFHLTNYPAMIETWSKNQKRVLQGVGEWNGGDLFNLANTIFSINPTLLSDQNAEHYTNLCNLLLTDSGEAHLKNKAEECEQNSAYETAAKYYEGLILIRPDVDLYRYRTGLCYENVGNKEKAAEYYYQLIYLFQDSSYIEDATARYLSCTGKTEVDPLPEGIDIEAEKVRHTAEELISKIVLQ